MNREQAEQQARVWQWWTGYEVQKVHFWRYNCPPDWLPADGSPDRQTGMTLQYWNENPRCWERVPDLSGPGSPNLRRAIEAKKWDIQLSFALRTWVCELFPNSDNIGRILRSGDSLEAALFRAALSASEGAG